LDSKDIKATFFLIGGNVISHPETVVYQHMTGHEIGMHGLSPLFFLDVLVPLGVHTWSHPALTTLTNEQVVAELGWTREAIKQVTGVTPVFFRPPYGDIDDRVRAIANAMNLIPVMWTTTVGNNGTVEWDSSGISYTALFSVYI
jgi:peptidoglycan/xylan/chitin deacetylase (PgdA/CDA1 family)